MAVEERTSITTLELISKYEYKIKFDFDDVEDIIMDEPKPLGESKGPNATRIIAAGVANCLSASFTFCLSKWKINLKKMTTIAKAAIRRNEKGRWRIHHIDVELHPVYDQPDHNRIPRCLEQFEDYCVVTESIRKGIPIKIEVISE
ncbi:MAG: OsmC family protein [Candidatus Ranarchaeia archaeon]